LYRSGVKFERRINLNLYSLTMVHNISKENSVFNEFLSEIRNKNVQQDRMRFRKNLERMGEVMAYELSKKLSYSPVEIETPLGSTEMSLIIEQPILATILRAGLPFHNGFLNFFDKADNAFISAYRKRKPGQNDFVVEVEYLSSPSLEGKELIIIDPMLATGSSMVLVYKALMNSGIPKHIHIVCAIASKEGINHVKSHLPADITIWVGAIDDELTANGYLVPGLGDAGDLAFGKKQ